jgi:hypothetical protein
MAGPLMAATVWNPSGNGIAPPATGDWGTAANWTGGLPPISPTDDKAVFNVPGAAECRVTDFRSGFKIVQGDNNLGGVVRITSGGTLDTLVSWSAIGYNDSAHMIVETGGTLNFGQHAWIGFLPGAVGTLDIDGGTVHVASQLGLGWSGGDGFINIMDGGLLALSNIHPTDSIKQTSVIDIIGNGKITIPGDFTGTMDAYIAAGKITGNGLAGMANVQASFANGVTTVTAVSDPVGLAIEPPVLSIRPTATDTYELTWPRGPGFYAGVTTNDLAAPGPWTPLDSPVTVSANENVQVVTNGDARAFYRLAMAPLDNTTLHNKSMMGYQGWFGAPTDGTPVTDRWAHWGGGLPNITSWGIDFYPDMSEYTAGERYEPGWTLPNGDTAYLYSAAHPLTVKRHCQWMWEYGIDGVFLQRFLSEVQDSRFFAFRNRVTQNIRIGAEAYNRVFAIMYDISGSAEADLLGNITNDWNYLSIVLGGGVTNSPSYARHNGKPVVTIWGLGFTSRSGTPAIATDIINFFKGKGMAVMGGVPSSWRTLNGDSKTDPAWAAVYRSYDIISPWTVGRYSSLAGADNWRVNKIVPDLAAATLAGVDYMPVIWPGFSWHNIHDGPLNQIPRLGGEYYWRQAYNAQLSGCSMLYTAMFDEMDEGTAMLKMAETSADLPAGSSMVALDADGISLPSDWYLQVGGEAARMLRGEIPLQNTLPITP